MVQKPDINLKTGSAKARKSAARLFAVQALYQIVFDKKPVDAVLREFRDHRIGYEQDGDLIVPGDLDLFSKIVTGVEDRRPDLEHVINAALNGREKELEVLLYCILLAGTFELLEHQDIDGPIIISDYLNVTHAFFDQSETKLVNGVLDRLKKQFRA